MEPSGPRSRMVLLGWAVMVGSAAGVLALGLLATTITERRAERRLASVQFVQPIGEWEADNSKWGVSFPRQFSSWELTRHMSDNTRYGGSNVRDYLSEQPLHVVLWAGFTFAKDYSQARGHFNSVADVTATKRVSATTPATCWTCKSPDAPRLMAKMGVDGFYAARFADLKGEVRNPIGCADCHDNKTMALRISRPALIEAMQRMGRDVQKATHQEMRSLVCAQCHVSYYFADPKTNRLVIPWDKGLGADDFDRYYKEVGFSDWTHAISGARMIKLRHADYEMWSQGVHAFRGVSCADCHLPYRSEGGVKYTDHQVRSPLYNVAASCQVCHRWSEGDIRQRVYAIQDKTLELRRIAEAQLAAAHLEIGDAMRLRATDLELAEVRDLVRRGQMYWDYVAATNGMGFHAPQESARVLAKAIDLARECRLQVNRIRARKGAVEPLAMPDLSTRAKADAFIKPFVEAQRKAGVASNSAARSGAPLASPSPERASR
ncbi:MAG TPA: ammonia-forming cytochrome c nitrite reductase subunit c552 [Chthonomonadales bacterium]|nr:ammonia-forming cytochrome c nitrite reductase subunit c552 [Chthonomonadales bacterium]